MQTRSLKRTIAPVRVVPVEYSCSIPEHCIDVRNLRLFIAKSALCDLIPRLHTDAKGVADTIFNLLHKNSNRTPGICQRLSGSDEPGSVLALDFGLSEETARKWNRRDRDQVLSAVPNTLQTNLTPCQEAVVVQWRRVLLLPLGELIATCRQFLNPDVSRPLRGHCLRWHGVSDLKELALSALLSRASGRTPMKAMKDWR